MEPSKPTPAEATRLYDERQKRVTDAIELRVPDRVPVVYTTNFWHATYGKRTIREVMYDFDVNQECARNAALELQPDAVGPTFAITAVGPMLDAADYIPLKWAGHGVADTFSYQYLDMELMKGDEYDLYLEDPSYFYITRFMPRISKRFAALGKLPQLPGFQHLRLLAGLRAFSDPEVQETFKALAEVGVEADRLMKRAIAINEEFANLGFPSIQAAGCYSPFDYFADYLRGSKGIMLDVYRRKDKLLAAMDKITPMLIRGAVGAGKAGRSRVIFMPMHWGLGGFMSLEQFKTFFWAPLRRVMMGMIEQGVIPCVFWEGDCTSRLETIADIPPGKAIYWFERSDIFRAKEVLKGIACLRGNVPASLLNIGKPEDVTAYCRKLIEVVGKDGGFILDGAASGISDEAKLENVHAMFRSVHQFQPS